MTQNHEKNYAHSCWRRIAYDLILKLNNIGIGQPKIPTVMAAMTAITNNERRH